IIGKDYTLINIETNFYNFHKGLNRIGNINGPKDLENVIKMLDELEIIGEKPLTYWENNKVMCKLDIINPEYIIKTAAIEATNQDIEDFQTQIQELLKLQVIRRSTSKHRSAAFMVRNHSEIVRGKARMVINYKRLNDNTRTDAYKLPDKSELLNRIQGKRIFSKFDCKSGYWQVKMHPDSIEWTAFTCPEGHFEWLAMPFGLKTAPPIFQRKMDEIFGEYKKFVLVYVDDILVFSRDLQEHLGHLQTVFRLFVNKGIIISKKKMELCKTHINFLGITLGDGKIKLQPHIAKKVLEMPDKLDKTKDLQKFLGLVNYARNFIKDLGKIAGPLYSKTGGKG
ncbi:reverse transcriptase family protein, partial [Corynebacterium sp. MC-02]|nr:reverse transcriptase family protein [Corynebacterium pseudokroppenstedtii]